MKSKKLNIMKTRPQISDAEIQSMMDFDKVLHQHASAKRWRYIPVIAGVLVALVAGWFFLKPTAEKIPVATTQPGPKEEIKPTEVLTPKPAEVIVKKQKQEVSQPKEATADIYTEAEPVSGYDDLYAYFEKELKYPADASVAAEGDVAVTFVINKKGKPEQIKFINSLGPEFDKEVIRVINNMPGWKPATQNGKPVPAKISQSFTFDVKSKDL